jgi:DNA polymerase
MDVFLDFESRSPLDIKKCGAYAYAEHPDTEVLCLAIKVDDGATRIWRPEWVEFPYDGLRLTDEGLRFRIEMADHIHAHNAGFERCMWTEHMVKRRGFPEIPISKWDDTAARAAMCALPRSLDGACKALGVSQQKDAEGYKLMLKMCRPRALRKKERDTLAAELGMTEEEVKSEAKAILSALKCDPRAPGKLRPDYHRFFAWHESAEDLVRLCRYCIQDVEAEYALAQELPPLPKMERRIWELDQTINDRGILADLTSVEHAGAIIEEHSSKLQEELQELTGGAVGTAKQVAKMTAWMGENGCEVDGLTKQDVEDALSGEIDPAVRRVLEIRQSLSMSSTAKLAAIRAFACRDGRLRGMFMYHGASTGRWTGKGPQPQNFPRGNETLAPDMILDVWLPRRDSEWIELLWSDPMDAISSCLRGLFIASPGHDLIAADYSAIEGRGLAFLAGEEHVLEGYRNKLDPYRVAASGIFKEPYDQIDKKKRQVGKVAELACGYQGSWKAMLAFGADRMGMTEQEMKDAVAGWREARPKTVALWKGLEQAAYLCVEKGVETKFRAIKFRLHGKFLQMILPSGRPLWYFAPRLQPVTTPWGEEKRMVTAMTVDSTTKQWVRRSYHGGLWAENATQAFCRDLLALGLIRCEAAGYRPVLHVHDEIVAEVPEGWGSVEEMEAIMSEVPKWAEGMPISAEGYRAKRYRK